MKLIIIVILVVQVVGFLTILHFNSKVKDVERDNKRLKRMAKTGKYVKVKPIWDELGFTEEEYNQTRNMVYAIDSPKIPLYTPGLDDVYQQQSTNNPTVIEEEDKPVQPKQSELGELLGIQDINELEELQKEIEGQQTKIVTPPKTGDIFEDQSSATNDNVEEYLTQLMNEIDNPSTVDTTVKPIIDTGSVTVAPIGAALDFFDEISKTINEEEQITPVLFSEDNNYVLQEDMDVLPTDDDVPLEEEQVDVEDEMRMIQILNLLDTESTRMENEFDLTGGLDEKTLAKQEIQTKLASLSSEEGKNNLKEIILLLAQLYDLEGKEEDMKSLKAEYKEYFEEDTSIPIIVYEDDIISTDTIEPNTDESFDIPDKYLWMASAKISDGLQGEQRWLGRIIGLGSGGDVSFIHFRDVSQRIWINVSGLEPKLIEKLEKGDLLTIFVKRNGDSIIAKDVQSLNKTIA